MMIPIAIYGFYSCTLSCLTSSTITFMCHFISDNQQCTFQVISLQVKHREFDYLIYYKNVINLITRACMTLGIVLGWEAGAEAAYDGGEGSRASCLFYSSLQSLSYQLPRLDSLIFIITRQHSTTSTYQPSTTKGNLHQDWLQSCQCLGKYTYL